MSCCDRALDICLGGVGQGASWSPGIKKVLLSKTFFVSENPEMMGSNLCNSLLHNYSDEMGVNLSRSPSQV